MSQDHQAGCHPAEVTLDELLDLTAEPVAVITDPACRHRHQRRGPRWLDLIHATLFGTWANTGRTLLYWCALIGAIIAVTIVATPAIQAGALGLGGLWWFHRRHTTGNPPPPEPHDPAPALVLAS